VVDGVGRSLSGRISQWSAAPVCSVQRGRNSDGYPRRHQPRCSPHRPRRVDRQVVTEGGSAAVGFVGPMTVTNNLTAAGVSMQDHGHSEVSGTGDSEPLVPGT
jgi:hypothetical protein